MDFSEKIAHWAKIVNEKLADLVVPKNSPEATIYEAMRYSLLSGGKRLRPVLSFAVNEILGGRQDDIIIYTCALEMIHTYSLIHDDLPAMDNDDYRRGRKTNHKVFGEDIAILAGDALLNYAFEIMLEDIYAHMDSPDLPGRINAARLIAKASGTSGMVGGQVVDLESQGRNISYDILEYMHKCKTGALIKAAVQIPLAINNVTGEYEKALLTYAENLGLAFQIKDDILDIEGNLEEMGKKTGSDSASGKITFTAYFGLDKAKEILKSTVDAAIESIAVFGDKANFLTELAGFIAERRS